MKTRPGATETAVGWVILGLLVVIAGGMIVKQARYDQALFSMSRSEPAPSGIRSPAGNGLPDLLSCFPPGFQPLTAAETFEPTRLSDKIDGRAELYLAAGFRKLTCQRFAEAGDRSAWLEIYVYDMGRTRNAFAVYSTQRRSDARQLDFTPLAYRTANAVFFASGRNYLEIIAAKATPNLSKAMLSLARTYLDRHPANLDSLRELALFPRQHLIHGSIALLAADAFGCERLDDIMIARYEDNGTPLNAFLSVRRNSREADSLAAAYAGFLIRNGGREVPLTIPIPHARLIQIFDSFELVFSYGQILAGVHEAETQPAAERLALALQRKLAEEKR